MHHLTNTFNHENFRKYDKQKSGNINLRRYHHPIVGM